MQISSGKKSGENWKAENFLRCFDGQTNLKCATCHCRCRSWKFVEYLENKNIKKEHKQVQIIWRTCFFFELSRRRNKFHTILKLIVQIMWNVLEVRSRKVKQIKVNSANEKRDQSPIFILKRESKKKSWIQSEVSTVIELSFGGWIGENWAIKIYDCEWKISGGKVNLRIFCLEIIILRWVVVEKMSWF